MAMSTSCLGVAAMQQARRAPSRHQVACAAAAAVLSRHARAATATLRLLPINVASHSNSLAPRPARQCLDKSRERRRCRAWMQADSDGIAHPIRLQATVQRCRSFSLVCAAGAQDVCAITHLKSPWPFYPSLSVPSSSHWRRSSGQIRCSSYSSVWTRSAPSANASVDSGGTQTIEQLWEEYFADTSLWWDSRVDKKNPRSPDLRHKVTRKALWIDGWSTPAWVKARLTPVTQGRSQCHVGYDTGASQDAAQGKRLRMGNSGEGNSLPTRAGEGRPIVQGGGGSMHVQSASTTSEAIAILKNRLQRGITIDSYTYVDVLKRCSKEKDLLAAKQVHECIIKSGMDQNTYVWNSLLSAYIRCERLQDARRVFDGLLKKDVLSWKVMIGGYAQRNHANDAMEVFHQMRQENVEADEITYLRILKACANPSALKWGKEVHAYIRHGGLESNVRVGTALLQMYAKCGCIKEARQTFDNLTNVDVFSWNVMIGAYVKSGSIHEARQLFDRMEERDVSTWNVMIGACSKSGFGEEGYGLFLRMKRDGFKPNAITYISILNACASAGALEWVKEVHGHALEAGLESDLRVSNALIHMYAKCGSIDDARAVFDRMVKRDVVTWTVMIGAYAKSGCGEEAYRLFLQMKQEGLKPDAFTCTSILNACASAGALEWVKEVHGHALEAGLESDLRLSNALIHMYAKCGSIDDARVVFDRMVKRDVVTWTVMIGAYVESGSIHEARLVFDRMEERDVVTWNVMIGAYAKSGCGEEAYRLFLQMKQEGLKPDAFTCTSILNACASAGALEWVKEVHGHALEAGLESDLRVGNALIHMYAKCGSIDDARVVFDRMVKRDVFTWTVMIGAYVESGSIHGARLVFDRMEERDVITWNVMIGAYAKSGCGEEAYGLFHRMKREGFKPNAVTYISILNACASAGALEWVKEVHGHALEAGLESDLRVGNALIHMYAKCGSIDDARVVFDRMVKRDVFTWTVMIGAYVESGSIHGARLVFDRMEERDVVTWNVMIGAFAKSGCGEEAYGLFLQMKQEGFKPNAITYISILNACASAGALEWVKEVHGHALEAGLESDLRVGNALIHMYAKCGSIDDARLVFDRMVKRDVVTWNAMVGAYVESGSIHEARLVFDRMEERDVITWNVMIGAYAKCGCGEEAYGLFLQMKREGFKPNAVTYISILNACASAGALEWVKEVHGHALEAGLESDLRVGNALIHMYAKCGSIDDARLVFDGMMKRDVFSWNVMIGGLALHGCGHEALEEFENMDGDGVKPDGLSFVAVLSACSHAGLVDDGRRLFLAMTRDYGIPPDTVLCNCMVDLLGRAGHLEEAMLFIRNMPVEPDGATWGALLGACRSHGNVELAEIAAKERLNLEPSHAGTYVLLSNIYAAAGKWYQVSLVRTMMQERGIRKEPGRSWIEVDNKIHRFVVGDTSHPETKEIYAELNRLTERIKAEGYIPDTRLVLQNIDEEDKELALCSHSEKLAIAYGLMRTRHGKPIRVYKNLRVCSDCHAATKLISKVTGREIVARDANRFHHFNDGVCSCGDYW